MIISGKIADWIYFVLYTGAFEDYAQGDRSPVASGEGGISETTTRREDETVRVSTYWSKQGRNERIAGFRPKTQGFFVAWFGHAGVEIYQCYINAYRRGGERR